MLVIPSGRLRRTKLAPAEHRLLHGGFAAR